MYFYSIYIHSYFNDFLSSIWLIFNSRNFNLCYFFTVWVCVWFWLHIHLKMYQKLGEIWKTYRQNNFSYIFLSVGDVWYGTAEEKETRMKTSISSKAFVALPTDRRTKYLQNRCSFMRGIWTQKNWSDISIRGREKIIFPPKRGWHMDRRTFAFIE